MGWFTKKPALTPNAGEKLARVVDDSVDAVSKLGAMMERDRLAIHDTSELPLPKDAMKAALKIAWHAAPDDRTRGALGAGFIFLSNFQDGVGRAPIEGNVPYQKAIETAREALKKGDNDPLIQLAKETVAETGRYEPWAKKAEKECRALALEFAQFEGLAKNEPIALRLGEDGLSERPATRALISRAAQDKDAYDKYAKEGLTPALINAAVGTAVLDIALIAMKATESVGDTISLSVLNNRGDPLPYTAPRVLAFADLVTTEILTILSNEGYPLAFKNFPKTGTVDQLFCMRTAAEKTKLNQDAGKIALQVLQTEKTKEWRGNLRILVYGYLMQFTTADDKLKAEDFQSLFGSMLKSFLSNIG